MTPSSQGLESPVNPARFTYHELCHAVRPLRMMLEPLNEAWGSENHWVADGRLTADGGSYVFGELSREARATASIVCGFRKDAVVHPGLRKLINEAALVLSPIGVMLEGVGHAIGGGGLEGDERSVLEALRDARTQVVGLYDQLVEAYDAVSDWEREELARTRSQHGCAP